jgi:hypothetical protein
MDPVEDFGEAEFVPVHCAADERVSVEAIDPDVKPLRRPKMSVAPKAMRLLPSRKPWLFPRDSISAAASSSREL